MQADDKKYITILLTELTDNVSRIVRLLTHCSYTHASIGLGRNCKEYYSFNTKKGFCIEKPERKRKDVRCLAYHLEVSNEVYADIEQRINNFIQSEITYGYSFLGVALCIFRIPYNTRNKYFCTQFVTELLEQSGAANLSRRPSVYLPKDFFNEPQLSLFYRGSLKQLSLI